MNKKMQIIEMKRKDFEVLPARDWQEDIGPIDSLVILPKKYRHENGFRCMDFVAVRKGEAVCRLSGCSDVICLDGIGGFGKDWICHDSGVPRMKEVVDISIDCLSVSGLLHIFSHSHQMTAGLALRSFELFFNIRREK